jgi:hypothetical protein
MATGQTTVTFNSMEAGPIDPNDPRHTLNLELNSEDNEGKSEFAPNGIDEAIIRLYKTSSAQVYFRRTYGTWRQVTTRVPIEVEEDVEFDWSKEEQLYYLPDGAVTWEWLGTPVGRDPVFDGTFIRTSAEVLGILRCTYTTLVDQYGLKSDEEIPIMVFAYQGVLRDFLTVNFAGDGEDRKQYEVRVLDYCTGDPVPGATVYVNGVSYGQTANDGRVQVGTYTTGSENTLRIVKSGYLDSDNDSIRNDSFIA